MSTTAGISPQVGSQWQHVGPNFYNLSPKYQQPLYHYNTQNNSWIPVHNPVSPYHTFLHLKILSWNIDFAVKHVDKRTKDILDYIESQIHIPTQGNETELDIPLIIMFQEVSSQAFPILLSHPFIRTHYDLTTISCGQFEAHYGTVSCVPKILTPFVSSISRFPFLTSGMGRDALILDLDLPYYPEQSQPHMDTLNPNPNQDTIRIRIANTHLESLRGRSDTERQTQLRSISKLIFAVHGGLVAGDMNAIAPTDFSLPRSVGLIDCWEVLKSDAPEVEGHTWGYQSGPRNRWPARRLDKVLISGGLEPVSIERFGVGEQTKGLQPQMWLTDHYGLIAQVKII